MFKKSWLLLGLLGVLALGSSLFYLPPIFSPAEAQSDVRPISGYAWSSTVGAIQFNHLRQNPVVIQADNTFTGYAWSPNIGWVNFNPPGPYPAGGVSGGVRLSGSNVVGWARACAGMIASGANQSDPNNVCTGNSRTDGWDGWIKFDHGRSDAVTIDSEGKFSGYAWGSNVVGWVNMGWISSDGGNGGQEPPCINGQPNPNYQGPPVNCGNGPCPIGTPGCPDPDTSILIVLVSGNEAGDASVTITYESANGSGNCVANVNNPCNLQVVVGSQVVIESNIEPTSWGNEGPCVNEEGNNCSFGKSNEEERVNVVFGSDDGPGLPFVIDKNDPTQCRPAPGGRCSLLIDCDDLLNCGSGGVYSSNYVAIQKLKEGSYDWTYPSSIVSSNPNNLFRIVLRFCPTSTTVGCFSTPDSFVGVETIYLRAFLDIRDRSGTPRIDIEATDEDGGFASENIIIQYIDSNVGQKSD